MFICRDDLVYLRRLTHFSVSFRSFCKRGHNGLFKILGGVPCSVGVWAFLIPNFKGGT